MGITAAMDAGIGPVKERARGLSGGELVVSMASAQLAGEDFLVGLDRRRADTAGQELEPVPTPASTTAAGIARRFGEEQLRGIEAGIGKVNTTMLDLLPLVRRTSLLKVATIDGDATDVQVYGHTKEKAKHAYTGELTLRSHIGYWAEAGVPVAAELMGGTEDPRSNAVEMLDRSIAALPVGVEKIRCRWDAGYFASELAAACVERGVEFAIGAKRTGKVMAAAKGLGRYAWVPAVGMDTPRGRDHRVPARALAQGRQHCLYCPADPDTGRPHPHRAGPQAPHHRQSPARPGVGGPDRRGLRVLVHPHQPGRQ